MFVEEDGWKMVTQMRTKDNIVDVEEGRGFYFNIDGGHKLGAFRLGVYQMVS